MTCVQLLLYVFTYISLVVTSSAHGDTCQKLCDFTDTECTTKIAQNVFKAAVPGIKGLSESSDPLYLDEVEGSLANLKYKLSNITLAGLSKCQVTVLRLNDGELTYQYGLHCPKLLLNYNQYAKGLLGPTEIDTNGLATVTYNDYILNINGNYGKFTNEEDHKIHFYLKDFTLDTESIGGFTYESHSPLHSVKTKSELVKAYIDQNLKAIEISLKSSTLEKLIAIYLNNIDIYLKNYFINLNDLHEN